MGINQTHYLETRQTVATPSQISDVARHWQARYLTGKAVVIAEDPTANCKQLQKQWQRLTGAVQTERAAAAGADKILRLTATITRMQQLVCVPVSPPEQPNAHVWCTWEIPDEPLPPSTRTIYVLRELTKQEIKVLQTITSAHALVVDYTGKLPISEFIPKTYLIKTCDELWHELEAFLAKHNISIAALAEPNLEQPARLDDALDTLLSVSSSFLRIAHQFQEAWQLAQPLETTRYDHLAYDTAFSLARRVNMLSPSYFNTRMFTMHADDDQFFMYDSGHTSHRGETMAAAITRHLHAGRVRLAAAIEKLELAPNPKHFL